MLGPSSRSVVTGAALAVDLLLEGLEARGYCYSNVDATRSGVVAKSGTFSFRRAFDTLCVIALVWWHLCAVQPIMRLCPRRRSVSSVII